MSKMTLTALLAILAALLLSAGCDSLSGKQREEDDSERVRRYPQNRPSNWENQTYGN